MDSLILLVILLLAITIVILISGSFKSTTYVLTLMLIVAWLLLFPQLLSPYVIGIDAHWELAIAERTLLMGTWDSNIEGNTANGALSITILAPIVSLISGVRIDTVTKIIFSIFPILFVPIIWGLNRQVFHFSLKESFVALLLLIGTSSFMMISVYSRQAVALFVMLLLTYFLTIKKINISHVILLLIIGLTFSHYSTALIFVILLIVSTLIMLFKGTTCQKELFTYVLFSVIFIVTWLLFVVVSTSQNAIFSLQKIINNILDLTMDNTSNVVQEQFNPSFGDVFSIMNYGINLLILLFLFIGIVYSILMLNTRNEKSNVEINMYVFMSLTAILMLFSSILPGASFVYNPERIYLTLLVLFNGLFLVGIRGVRDIVSFVSGFFLKRGPILPAEQKNSLVMIIAASIVILHFLLQVGFPSQLIFNEVDSKYFGDPCDDFHYTLNEEITSIQWINIHKIDAELLFTDIYGRGFLPLQSYGSYKKEDVFSISGASQIHAGYPILYYQQKYELAMKNHLYLTDFDKIRQINFFLSQKSKILNFGNTNVYIVDL